MLRMATIKETKNPSAKKANWSAEKEFAFFNKSNAVAAAIVGTAKRKENSTIAFRFNPKKSPPQRVAAERETPGMTASDWITPIQKALRYGRSPKSSIAAACSR